MTTDNLAAERRQDYDGTSPFPGAEEHVPAGRLQIWLTARDRDRAVRGARCRDLPRLGAGVLAHRSRCWPTGFYVFTGLGVTVGFHRLLTHGSFTARPWLRVALAVAGSMGFQGNVIDWVAVHRRHHAFTDRPGDPHSPYRYGTDLRGQLRGLGHAHLGWLFDKDTTPAERYAPDMVADPAMQRGRPRLPRAVRAVPGAAVRGGMGDHRLPVRRPHRLPVGRADPRRPVAARHLERQLPVPRDRREAVQDPPPRPFDEPVAAGPAVVRRELAQRSPQ